jgi:hypothetical protein
MRIMVTSMAAIGSYFSAAYLIPRIYSLGLDIPNFELGQNAALWLTVAIMTLVSWSVAK